MANNNKDVSRAITGMQKDAHPISQGENSYEYALNARLENFDGSGPAQIQNDSSNILCTGFPQHYEVIGFVNVVEQGRIIWFLGDGVNSEIGETHSFDNCKEFSEDGSTHCDDCQGNKLLESVALEQQKPAKCCKYTTLSNTACLNFRIDYPISSVEYRILNGELQIYFTEELNGRRYLKFDYDASDNLVIQKEFHVITGFEDEPCEVPIYGTDIDCNRIRVQPNIASPCIEFVDIVSGGSTEAGVYQFVIAFSDEKGNKMSSYISSTNPIPIQTDPIRFETNYVTDRAIALRINGLDATGAYGYYNLAVIKTVNNSTSFFYIATLPVTQTTYVYTGNDESEKKLTIGDIFQRFPYYKSAQSVTSSNNLLFWASLKEYPKLNLQRAANKINLMWQTIAIPEGKFKDPKIASKYRGYMRDEVYPFGIVYLFDNGQESSVYHIPGRASIPSDLEIIDNPDVVKENNCFDCTDPVAGDVQVQITSLNQIECTNVTTGVTLIEDNSQQAANCPLTSYSHAGHTPVIGFGTAPIVHAGADQTISYYASIPLNGTVVQGSAAIVETIWTQLSGPNQVTISDSSLLNTSFSNYNAGTYTFELYARDASGDSSVDTIVFTVNIPPNLPPISDPGADKLIELPTNVSYLNGANSSDEDVIASYLWSQVSGPNTATIANPTFAYTDISNLIQGNYIFKLVVKDSRGCSSEATTKIYVLRDPATTVPQCANLLYPTNGSVVSSFSTVVLDWEDVDHALSYDVYLRTNTGSFSLQANSSDSTHILTGLTPNTIYHWYIRPKNAAGSALNCENCYRSFITPTQSSVANCQKERWEVYNTATIEGGDLEVYEECDETCYQFGKLAYWQSTERYPNNPVVWGELCGQPIRHPKFPDSYITHIHNNENGQLDYNTNNLIFPIGIKVDHDSIRQGLIDAVAQGIVTEADVNRIIGYKIVRGNRFQNKSIVAKGMLYDVNQYRRKINGKYFDNQDIYFSNYPYNDLRNNPFVTDDFRNYDDHDNAKGGDLPFIFSNRYTFHSPDTHFTEPGVGSKLKLETAEYGMSEGYFAKSNLQSKQKFLSTASYSIAFTAGIIAALMKTEEKEIKEYTVKGSIISGMGLSSGILGPFLPYQTGTGAAIVPESILDSLTNPTKTASINAATEVKTRTVQGKYRDWVNPVYLATKKPALLPLYPLMLANYLGAFLTTVIQEANIVIDLIKALTPFKDWSAQYHSVGKYNAFTTIANAGNKIRSIQAAAYLKGENSFINEPSNIPTQFTSIKFNNWHRESSLYLKYNGQPLPNAGVSSGVQDQSRFTLEDNDVDCTFDKRVNKPISAYYAAIKNYVPDQYGTIYNIEYLATDSCSFGMNVQNNECKGVYGGDTFINRFGLKIKVPYFLRDTFKLPDGTDFNYADYPNLGVPRHYYNSTLGLGSELNNIGDILSIITPNGMASLLGRPKSIRDCSTNKLFYQNGYIYLYHYGIPYFLVESDVNVDLRYAENLKEKAFYPVQGDLDYWLQEENVPIREDNTYLYNNTYSKQNKETPFVIDGPSFDPLKDTQSDHSNRIIYTSSNNWLTYKANDYFDFPLNKGKITSIEGIENDTVLVRTTNSTSVFKSVIRTQISGQTVQVGDAGIFANPPQEFAETTLGYVGSQHKAILHTEFGHIWVDAKRGQVFNLSAGGDGLDEISKNGMKNWFKENLPFHVLKDFPNLPESEIDNNFGGIGITMSFDKRYNRFFLTKLDYKVKMKGITYDKETKKFSLHGSEIRIGDKRYFESKSWTLSYNFFSKSWVSEHSFTPNYYIDFIDHFGSGNKTGFWLHNVTNSSNQVYYGKLYPFIFEPILKFSAIINNLNSIELDTEVRRYTNEFDYSLKPNIPGVNKAVIYNDLYSSGLLKLIKSDKNDLSSVGKYPIKGSDNWTIELAQANYKWRLNQFYNLVQKGNELPLWLYKANNIDKELNPRAFNYKQSEFDLARLKGQWFKLRLINDELSNYKIIHKFAVDNQTTQFR